MENKMNNDFFEELLREATENFTMQPSRRVWTSIYNNFHPSRKWPSFSSSLFIAFSIILASFLNVSVVEKEQPLLSKATIQERASNPTQSTVATASEKKIMKHATVLKVTEKKAPLISSFHSSVQPFSAHTNKILNQQARHQINIIPAEISEVPVEQITTKGINNEMSSADDKTTPQINADLLKNLSKKSGSAVYFQFYATPSYGFRFMNRNNPEIISQSSFISNAGPMVEVFELQQSPALNLEAGGTVLFPVNRDFRLKAGMQLNYTNYKVLGEQLPYPFYSNMQLNTIGGGSALEAHLSEISNVSNLSTGGELLNNNTYQISLPVGTDFKLMGNGQLRWYAGATIQPSYLMGSNPYLITADMKNYVNDPSFVRKWNINTSFETFITYQLKGGTILNAGPQIRYQVFSTYNRKYIYDERLYNIGIKLGITPRF